MTIAHGAIVAAVIAVLTSAPSLAGTTVLRNRNRRLDEATDTAIVVRKTSSDPSGVPLLGQGTDWQTQVRVECYARTTDGRAADEACDDLLALAHAAILAADPTLGGLVMGIDPPRIGWDEDELDMTLGCAIAQYPVQHRTATNSLTADL